MAREAIDLPRLTRNLPLEFRKVPAGASGGADESGAAEDRFEIAISSNAEVERRGWFGERWIEILSHAPGAVIMDRANRGLSFLEDHETLLLSGIVEGFRVDEDGKTRGVVRFSRNEQGQKIKRDMEDGIRPFISVGYDPKRARLVETREGDLEVWEVTLWEPMEASSVPLDADITVGVGRSAAGSDHIRNRVVIEGDGNVPRRNAMDPKTAPPDQGTETPAAERTASPAIEPGTDFRAQAAEISRMADAYGMASKAADWIARGLTPDQVSTEILKLRKTDFEAAPASETIIPVSQRDASRYSYSRAIMQAADGKGQFSGLEGELHQEIVRRLPESTKRHDGIFVPMRLGPGGTRTMDTKTAGKGVELVFDRPGEMIELLRDSTLLARMGARILTGLTAPIPFARQIGGLTVHWVPENPASDVSSSDEAYDIVTLFPHTMQGTTALSRQLLVLGTVDGEMMVRGDLAAAHGEAFDQAGMHGSGTNGEPMGLYSAPGVLSQAMGGVPDFTKLVAMTTAVRNAKAQRGSLGWITTPGMAGKLMTVLVASAAGSEMIWTGTHDSGRLIGYPAASSSLASATLGSGSDHCLVHGNFGDIIMGTFGAMEIVADPYSQKKKGLIEITSFQMADVLFRHGWSFCKATGATIS
jgi:HK97 family phage major capsid protein